MLSCVLLCSLAGAGAGGDGKLEIVNPRATYGHLGAVRPKGKGILPGVLAHKNVEINKKQNPLFVRGVFFFLYKRLTGPRKARSSQPESFCE